MGVWACQCYQHTKATPDTTTCAAPTAEPAMPEEHSTVVAVRRCPCVRSLTCKQAKEQALTLTPQALIAPASWQLIKRDTRQRSPPNSAPPATQTASAMAAVPCSTRQPCALSLANSCNTAGGHGSNALRHACAAGCAEQAQQPQRCTPHRLQRTGDAARRAWCCLLDGLPEGQCSSGMATHSNARQQPGSTNPDPKG